MKFNLQISAPTNYPELLILEAYSYKEGIAKVFEIQSQLLYQNKFGEDYSAFQKNSHLDIYSRDSLIFQATQAPESSSGRFRI